MPSLGTVAQKIRSKNAGPFWLTVDIFCGTETAYDQVRAGLGRERLAAALSVDPARMKWFEIPSLHVIKVSIPRPVIQGSREDRDMHGAALAALIAELPLN